MLRKSEAKRRDRIEHRAEMRRTGMVASAIKADRRSPTEKALLEHRSTEHSKAAQKPYTETGSGISRYPYVEADNRRKERSSKL